MLKIKDKLLKRIYQSQLTKNQLKLLLFLVLRADETGCVQIHHTELKEELRISNGSFYESISFLEKFHFITRKRDGAEIKVKILGNDFTNDVSAYTKLNTKFFTSEEYLELKAGEITTYLFTYFQIAKKKGLEVKNEDRNRYKSFKKNTYTSIARNTNMSLRGAKHYINELVKKKFISFGARAIDNKAKNGKLDVLTLVSKHLVTDKRKVSEKGNYEEIKVGSDTLYNEHLIKNLCRKYKIESSEQNIVDAAMLLRQYKNKAVKLKTDISLVIKKAVEHLAESYSELNSRLLHKMLLDEFNMIYDSLVIQRS